STRPLARYSMTSDIMLAIELGPFRRTGLGNFCDILGGFSRSGFGNFRDILGGFSRWGFGNFRDILGGFSRRGFGNFRDILDDGFSLGDSGFRDSHGDSGGWRWCSHRGCRGSSLSSNRCDHLANRRRRGDYARAAEDLFSCFRGLRALANPRLYALRVHGHEWRVCMRIVGPESFEERAIALRGLISHHQPV
ncbi:MAG: hypothetical protein ABI939_09870, partial [Anaerolineaceae bacterium]